MAPSYSETLVTIPNQDSSASCSERAGLSRPNLPQSRGETWIDPT